MHKRKSLQKVLVSQTYNKWIYSILFKFANQLKVECVTVSMYRIVRDYWEKAPKSEKPD